jgi:hypothetical protein
VGGRWTQEYINSQCTASSRNIHKAFLILIFSSPWFIVGMVLTVGWVASSERTYLVSSTWASLHYLHSETLTILLNLIWGPHVRKIMGWVLPALEGPFHPREYFVLSNNSVFSNIFISIHPDLHFLNSNLFRQFTALFLLNMNILF